MRRLLLPLLPFLALLALSLLSAAPAAARMRDTLTGDATDYSPTISCRGAKILATTNTVIEDFNVYTKNSSGKFLEWHVFEGTTSNGTYDTIAHLRSTGASGASYVWENSGPLNAPIVAGRYYVTAVCWSVAAAITIRVNTSTSPPNPSFGTFVNAVSTSSGAAPPVTGASWSLNSYRIHMQVFTTAGSGIQGGDPTGASGYPYNGSIGNAIDVTEDTLLRSVIQKAEVTTSVGTWGIGAYGAPWYIFRCAGTCSSGASYDLVLTYTAVGIGGSGVTFETWLTWSPNIILEKGYRYYIGIDQTATGVGVNKIWYVSSSGETRDFGSLVSFAYISATGVIPTPSPVNLTGGLKTVQRLLTTRSVSDSEQTGVDTDVLGSTAEFGNIVRMTVPTKLTDYSFQVDPGYIGDMSVGVYQSASQFGPYSLLWSGLTEHDDVGSGLLTTQNMDLDVDPLAVGGTGFYLFVTEVQGATATSYRTTSIANPSLNAGTLIGRIINASSAAGHPATMSLNTTYGSSNNFSLVSCPECVDLDGDGVEFGDGLVNTNDDCNDRNATISPLSAELCDGLDNNCDNAVPSTETDADQDGVRGCAGDCDDGNAARFPGNTEVCDGFDNDCDNTMPSTEGDGDADGFLACTLVVAPTATVLGGGDCDASTSATSPGTALETCDGIDSNCDGISTIAYTSPPGTTVVSSGTLLSGNVFLASSAATITRISAELGAVPAGTTLTWAIYSATSTGGSWTRHQSATTTTGAATTSLAWFSSAAAAFSWTMTVGRYYAMVVQWTPVLQANYKSGATFPISVGSGSHVGSISAIVSSAPNTLTPAQTSFSSSLSRDMRVYTTSELDGDQDGFRQCEECNDAAVTVYPNAPELCDALDNDCNGAVPSTEVDADGDSYLGCNECDDTASARFPGNPELCDGIDNDCNLSIPTNETDADGDGQRVCAGDCNDNNSTVKLGASELCDGLDTDCDGSIPVTEVDNDGDGYNECAGLDCNDAAATTYPGAPELCDGLDNNCTSGVPANEADGDADGQRICAGDCNDTNTTIKLGAAELCDGLDNDCNGSVPTNEVNVDGDAYRVCAGDCNDSLSYIFPTATEACDGRDSNCDTVTPTNEIDSDADGYIACTLGVGVSLAAGIVGGSDCGTSSAAVYPGAPELCDGSTVDNNCSGSASDEGLDIDGDGTNTCTDCDDTDSNVEPGASEICDGKDSNCDGTLPTNETDPDGDRYIACTLAANANEPSFILGGGDCSANSNVTYPGAPELCDGVDNDCASGIPSNEIDTDGDGVRACAGDCAPTVAASYPGATEICDGLDNDCNGSVPTNEADADLDAQRVCAGDCNDTNATIKLGGTELCDGRDNDCNLALGAAEIDVDVDLYFTCTYVASGGSATYGGSDCNDNNATVRPGATEVCDGLDNDCNTVLPSNELDADNDGVRVCQGDCADNSAARFPGNPEICDGVDNDCSGAVPTNESDADADGVRVCAGDCADTSAARFPGNPEICDAIDNDCDVTVDEGFNVDADAFFTGANAGCVAAYAQVDCNDTVASIYPGATETCNGVDQDCDGIIDDGFDVDGDGYRTRSVALCVTTYGQANTDCNDAVAAIRPGATETCNAIDDDCDAAVDEGFDTDADGFRTASIALCVTTYGAASVDCNDGVATTYPGASELCDLVDNDCDTVVDDGFDLDGDGYFEQSCPGGLDCNDGNAAVNPVAVETCDGSDQDCDYLVDDGFDADGDGYFGAALPGCATTWGVLADCVDNNPAINPFVAELCDGVDQDCDTLLDEDFDLDGDGYRDATEPACVTQYGLANVDCDDTAAARFPGATEVCDAYDDDCDLTVDDGFDTDSDGFVTGAVADCVAAYGAAQVDCNDGAPSVYPGATEICNSIDDSCDGVVPPLETDNDGDGFNECADFDCNDAINSVFPGASELCNGQDDDCNGVIDNGFDGDGDGYFAATNPFCASTYGAQADCNDAVATINPGTAEVCNGLDDNCNGGIDNTFDGDGDGFFNGAVAACITQYGASNVDCDDGVALVNPGRSEDCTNGVDDDCDTFVDVGFDNDGDGFDTCNDDCDDANPTVNPSATEICDGADNDCDLDEDEGFDADGDGFVPCVDDCDDTSSATNPNATEICDAADNDCDGAIDEVFDLDSDGFFTDSAGDDCVAVYPIAQLDCDDANPNVSPASSETCDGVDNNCSGTADETFDADADGAFSGAEAGCVATYGLSVDCDDGNVATAPGFVEICDGLDNNCNGAVPLDEIDNDIDGFVECVPVAGHVGNPVGGDDCSDGNAAVNPGAAELCNLVDDDCDLLVDEDFDLDGDGSPTDSVVACQNAYPAGGTDCDDADPTAYPGAPEACDGVDDNCDSDVDESFDFDGDGTFDGTNADCLAQYGIDDVDCDDYNPGAFPGNVEDCTNSVDDNCNGSIDEDVDEDLDGFTTCGGDCRDNDIAVFPNAAEVCDGLDQDCDFLEDEDFDGDGDGYLDAVACAGVIPDDDLDCDDSSAAVSPGVAELCNALDDDCDTAVDENFDLDSDGAFDRLNAGCIATYGALNTDCDDADPTLSPSATEICNDADDDCDGIVDEGFDMDGDGVYIDSVACVTTYGGPGDCDDGDDAIHPAYSGGSVPVDAAEELCDGVDNDCDGAIPEDGDADGFVDGTLAECAGVVDPDCDDDEAAVNPGADELCEDTLDNDCDGAADIDDSDCQGDDDDSADDDDDATGDDDDDDSTPLPPVVDEDFDGDRPTVVAGCTSCLGSVGSGAPHGGAAFGALLLLSLGLARRRRQRRAGRGPLVLLCGALLAGAVASTLPATAVAEGLDQEAERQLDFAWKELENKAWEKAISSAESALRLNPALYTAMVIKALAYEGMGELRKAESWLQTYLELTKSLSQAPQAVDLADRLKAKAGGSTGVKAEASVQVGARYGAFGDGAVTVGGLLGGRSYGQTPCAEGDGCAEGAETRPGFWATQGQGFGGGLSVRAEYFFGGWLLGLKVRYDLGVGEPVGTYEVATSTAPGHRLDVHVAFRPQLAQGLTSVRLLVDVGYGMRTWRVYETVSAGIDPGVADAAAGFTLAASEIGGGIGARIEPGRVVGIELRYGIAALLGGSSGANDHSVEVGVGVRPVKPLLIRAGFDMHIGSLIVQSSREDVVRRANVESLRAGLFVGAGVVF